MENGLDIPLLTPRGHTENQMKKFQCSSRKQCLLDPIPLCSLPASNLGVKATVNAFI